MMAPKRMSELGNLGLIAALIVLCATYLLRRHLKNKGKHNGDASFPGPKKLLSSSEDGHLGKTFILRIFRPLLRDGLVLSKSGKWKHRRRIMSKAFSHNALTGYMHSFNKHSEELVDDLDQLFDTENGNGKPINTRLWQHAFRIICETTLGFEVEDITNEREMVENLDKCKNLCVNRLLKPWLFIDLLWYFHPDKKILDAGCDALRNVAKKVVKRHRNFSQETQMSETKNENDPVPGVKKKFTSIVQEMIAAGVDDEGLLEEIMTTIWPGYETTAAAIQFLLMLLATHPEEQEKCRQEVDQIFENATLCPGGQLTHEGAGSLHHLQKCVQETLRLYPIIFLFLRKLEVPLKLDENLELPADTNVGIFVPGIHRNPDVYPNPDDFIPDRFSMENSKGRSPYAFLTFSMGPRNCLGFKYTMLEIKTTIGWILRHFEVTSPEKMNDVRTLADIALTPERGYNFSLKRRTH